MQRTCHIERDFPKEKGKQRASRDDIDDEPPIKKTRDKHSSDSNFLLLLALSCTVQTSRDTWLIDSGASRHMIGYGDHLEDVVQRELQEKVVLGDDARYVVKGAGATSFQFDSGKTLRMRDVLLVPGMTSNLIVASALEDKGYDVIFSRGQVFIQKFDGNEQIEIGIHDESLYRLSARLLKALVHDTVSLVELWHRRLTQLH